MLEIFQIITVGFAAFLALCTLLPFSKLPHGMVRGPEFGRLQLLAFGVALIPFTIWLLDDEWQMFAALCIGITIFANLAYVARFTPLWRKQSYSANAELMQNTDRHITLLASNVKMSNRNYDALLELVARHDPDMVTVIEPDDKWMEALAPLREKYAFHNETALDTGYGLALYSRLTLSDTEVRDRITEGVPSIKTTVTLPSGNDIRLYIVHPEPPVLSARTTARDSEIVLAGLDAKDDPLPSIIAGDLNDVAWSHTTRLFLRLTGLLDPRVGRGFYNTFNALYPFFRWPLDHLFHDARFRLVSMQRLEKIGSDHFPVQFTLALAETEAGETPDVRDGEEEEAREMISEEKKRDHEPVGTDWETDD